MLDITRPHTQRHWSGRESFPVEQIEVEQVEAERTDGAQPQLSASCALEPEVLSPQRLPIKLVAMRCDRVIDLDAGDRRGDRRPMWRTAGRFAATLGIGVAMFLAWPLADAARMMIANAAPQLWLTQPAGPGDVARPAAAARSDAAPSGLAGVRDRIAEIAASTEAMTRSVAELAAGQARLAENIAKVREEAERRFVQSAPRPASSSSHSGMARPVVVPAPRPAFSTPGPHLAGR